MSSKLKNSIKNNWKHYLYFGFIAIVFLFMRLYQITTLPDGLHIDEISMGYNTWSLSNFGVDRYGVDYPIYFNNAGSGQSSLYVYLAVILCKIFGYSIFLLRFVAVLFGIMLLVFGTLTAYEISGMVCAKAMSLIITVMPYFIMSERWAFDCNAMLPVFVMSLYFFIKLMKTNKTKYAVLTGLSFALTFYSYILSFLIVPVFIILSLIVVFILKKMNIINISIKNILIAAVVGCISICPIMLYIFVIMNLLPKDINVVGISITDASAGRLSEIFWQGFGPKEIWIRISNLLTYDKYEFTADKNYGVFFMNKIYLFGHEFYFTQILMFLGFSLLVGMCIYQCIKHKKFRFEIFVVIYIIAALVPLLFLEEFAIYRYNAVFFGFAFILAYLFTFLVNKKAIVCSFLCFALLVGNFCSYANYLFGDGFQEEHQTLGYFDKEFLGIFENYDELGLDKYDAIYVDDTTVYNPGLVILYGMRATPDEIRKYAKHIDKNDMIYKNVHVGIPKTVNEKEHALYVIRDVNSDTSLYTNSYEQLELYKKLIDINNTKKQLENMNCEYDTYNNYFMFNVG